uniref:B30.2/SPRY domain-containing protein n=1 Tax=Myripristis murdjan TaxID=586833 RepID=A0A667W8I7_9TELE
PDNSKVLRLNATVLFAWSLYVPPMFVCVSSYSPNSCRSGELKMLNCPFPMVFLGPLPNMGWDRLLLSGCMITERGCAALASALSSNPSHLRELDLSYNHPGDSGVKLLSAGLEDPTWRLDKLRYGETYTCDLTLDPNTANRKLLLSEDNRKVTAVREEQPYLDHPERFYCWEQVLCGNALTGRCYWEVEWKGQVSIGVTYRGIRRRGEGTDCCLGFNKKSWSLFCSDNRCIAFHDHKETDIRIPASSVSSRVAVYLDWSAGSLSFYRVSSDAPIHLHTFTCTFTEPLYPAFRVWLDGSSVCLAQMEE